MLQSKIVQCLKSAAAVLLLLMSGCILTVAPRSGPDHIFSVEPAPPFLTEELALSKARQTMNMESSAVNLWQPTRVDQPPSKAPDGTPDKYFVRWSFNPNEGTVSFVNGRKYRRYIVGLHGNRVICRRSDGI